MKKTPELLAPAGNLLSAITAFENGADAVYAGLKKFNARERTENFSDEEFIKLINFAKKRNKKVYVVLNTLLKESELRTVVKQLSFLHNLSPDAIIVQDIGLVYIIRKFFPDLTIHASTQMGIHNSAGVVMAKKMGISRVILERQVTFKELNEITKKSPLALEVFIHGALCSSLSGVCLFSSWINGMSGNRGKCMQLCRRKFTALQKDGFFFSTKDLCLIDKIPEFVKMGISSLKIEGRLRKPDHIAKVVSAYRLAIDSPTKIEDAKQILRGTINRQLSEGFTGSKAIDSVILSDKRGISSTFCGKILSEKKGKSIEISAMRRIHIGDKVRAQNLDDESSATFTVTEIIKNGRKVNKVQDGDKCIISTIETIPYNSALYKTGESYKNYAGLIENIPSKPICSLKLKININAFGIKIKFLNISESLVWIKKETFQEAKKHALDSTTVVNEFSITSSDLFRVSEIKVAVSGNLFVPASILKKLRREFWEWTQKQAELNDIFSPEATAEARFEAFYQKTKNTFLCNEKTTYFLNKEAKTLEKEEIICHNILDFDFTANEVILPFFCPEIKLASLKKDIENAYNCGVRKFRVTSLYAVELLKNFSDIEIYSSFPLPVCNSMAVCGLRKLGYDKVQLWVELEACELRNLVSKSQLPTEIYHFGRLPILVTRAKISKNGEIHDSRDARYEIFHDPITELTYLYPEESFASPNIPNTQKFIDLTKTTPDEKKISTFNTAGTWG
ncbi:MAG: U32 family peptidase [Verrucomicrobiota bacterium]|nr:U32 family peptidase [Verrucomicrobiota bacterium]